MVTRSEWLRQHYSKEMEEADKMDLLISYSDWWMNYEGATSDPGSEED